MSFATRIPDTPCPSRGVSPEGNVSNLCLV